MINPITETINSKEAVLFIYGNLSEVTRQFAEMLKYCKRKNLHVVDVFFETSSIKSYEEKCFNQLLDYIKHNKGKFAVVFYSRQDFNKFPLTHKLSPFRYTGRIDLHFAKDNVII
ncbi:MAG: hypothetical protein IJ532_08670 [Alphaproteobacteria bacterium]|nr:hypothetical protein [Alphaproteobacteria bacterium]